jgi:hypothetical protein
VAGKEMRDRGDFKRDLLNLNFARTAFFWANDDVPSDQESISESSAMRAISS